MPKQIYKIERFDSGILSHFEPRDIPANGLATSKGCDLSTVGLVRLLGSSDLSPLFVVGANDGTNEIDDYPLQAGSGFFYFAHDFTRPVSAGAPVEVPSDYYVVQYGPNVFIYATANSAWDGAATAFALADKSILLGVDSSGTDAEIRPVYYFASGALRVADSNYSNPDDADVANYKNKWFGHIKRSLFDITSDDIVNHNRWYVDNQELIAPTAQDASGADTGYSHTAGVGSTIAGLVDFDGRGTTVANADGEELIKIWADSATDTEGTWDLNTTYTFYISFIYDDSQESPVTKLVGLIGDSGSITTHASNQESVYIGVTVQYCDAAGTSAQAPSADFHANARITGARVYFTDPDDGEGTKYHILDIDFIRGCKKSDETSYTAWQNYGAAQTDFHCPGGIATTAITATTTGFAFQDPPKALTYDILNGYGPDEVTSAKYKCATIFNNRTYIGNIKQDGIVYSDRIIRSPINFEGKPQHDTFPETHKMDVASNDGDDVTHLEGFADRLIVFKRNSVYVVNVSQDGGEFVERHIPGIGVTNPCQVTQTEFGVAWVNSSGCYLYSDNQPVNLIDQKLSIGKTGTFSQGWNIEDERIPAITYIYSKKQLLVAVGLKSNFSNDNWIYDFKTKGWTYSGGTLGAYTKKRSNILINSNGVPVFLQYDDTTNEEITELYQMEDIPKDNNEFRLVTGDLTFGQPGVRKKIYKVYIAFKCSVQDTNVKVTYGVNGDPSLAKTFTGVQNFTSNELVTSANNQTWVWNGTDDAAASGETAVSTVANATLKVTNNAAASEFSYYSLGTLAAKPYTFKCYFTPGSSIPRGADKAETWTGIIKIGYGNIDPAAATIVATEYVSNQGYKEIDFSGTAVTYYFWFFNEAAQDGAFTYWSNMELLQAPEYTLAILKPSTSSEANNIYSFQLKLEAATPGSTAVPAGFELGDISIVHRTKNVR